MRIFLNRNLVRNLNFYVIYQILTFQNNSKILNKEKIVLKFFNIY